jgi:type VI secretion system protein ImpM
MPAPLLPAWYGKLPSLGDFASRRLDPDAVAFWDDWLCAALLGLREAQPDDWLSTYLGAPRWQFVLLPGALPPGVDPGGAAGILMPSVDRVGRYFPLLVLQSLPGLGTSQAVASDVWRWLDDLDALAASALDQDWTVDELEQRLAHLPAPGSALDQPVADSARGAWPALDSARWIRGEQRWTPQASGCTYWLSQSHLAVPELLAFHGVPPVPSDLLGRPRGA